ncbi:MAG: ATP-binding protein [Chthoniobacterales bacterium]
MNAEAIPLWLALLTQIGLGLAVFRANYRSYANQTFLLVSVFVSVWLLSLQFAFNALQPAWAEFWIRGALASGILIVNGFNLLRLAIVCRESGWREIGRRSLAFLLPGLCVIALCYTRFFLQSAELRPGEAPPHELVPQPIYGPWYWVWVAFFVASVLTVTVLYIVDLRRSAGMQRVELQFVLIAAVTLVFLTLATTALLPILSRAALVRLAPFRIVIFSIIIAYGIATRKIMDVGTFVRRLVSYLLLATYLAAIYFGVWWISDYFLNGSKDAGVLSHLIATVAVALSMAPARGVSKNFADKLFVNASGLDFRATVSKAAAILSSVTTLSDLLERFAATISEAVGTDRVTILLRSRSGFTDEYAHQRNGATHLRLELDDALIGYLEATHGPAVRDELFRIHQTPEITAVLTRMRNLQVAAAIGIFTRDHLSAVMLLGSRLSGRVYGSVEQTALQVLCGQLGVAVENAELFTEVQNAKIYNETLLENLTTGVIAVGTDERITVFNNEAGQITAHDPREMIDRPIDDLPSGLCEMLRDTLRTRERQENSELVIRFGDRNVILRASSSLFHGQEQQMLGALVVLTDITALKRLELQIRRSDRLASLGTLSAGMAHEIKNPLVSIKTFAQLLPERYQDSDFRDTFSNLIGHEIDRIDTLVNQLLRFARPAKPLLRPMHVHEVLEKSLQLVGHRLYQKEIKLARFWRADVDTIRADADQLEQVFLNFFLNAMEAMDRGGELGVTTAIERGDEWVAALSSSNGEQKVSEVLRITIRDNGQGIRGEDIPHVFDPFFTTKDHGTGLGLSVVHGIVQEHGGHIEVESEVAKGTAFHILLPLVRFERKVAAA